MDVFRIKFSSLREFTLYGRPHGSRFCDTAEKFRVIFSKGQVLPESMFCESIAVLAARACYRGLRWRGAGLRTSIKKGPSHALHNPLSWRERERRRAARRLPDEEPSPTLTSHLYGLLRQGVSRRLDQDCAPDRINTIDSDNRLYDSLRAWFFG